MINNSQFTKRLQKVIDYYNESASSFATKVGVQRSSISHILSGRNKPSLDFVLKILDSYPEVELYWLLNGKGVFPKSVEQPKIEIQKIENRKTNISPSLFEEEKNTNVKIENSISTPTQFSNNINSNGKEIDRIVIFYKDGTFSNFKN